MFYSNIFIKLKQLTAIAVVLQQRMIKIAAKNIWQIINKPTRRVGYQPIE